MWTRATSYSNFFLITAGSCFADDGFGGALNSNCPLYSNAKPCSKPSSTYLTSCLFWCPCSSSCSLSTLGGVDGMKSSFVTCTGGPCHWVSWSLLVGSCGCIRLACGGEVLGWYPTAGCCCCCCHELPGRTGWGLAWVPQMCKNKHKGQLQLPWLKSA